METVLVIFCVTSVIITSVIVTLELKGEKTFSMESYKGEINTTNFHGQRILINDKKTHEQIRDRAFETLDQQLNKLGYSSKEPKLKFINSTLKSNYNDIEELTPTELQTAFIAILQARESSNITA